MMINSKYKFTDRNYKTQKELKNLVGEEKYNEEMEYRKSRSFFLPHKNIEEEQLYIVQTPWILQKEINLMNEIIDTQVEALYKYAGKYDAILAVKESADKHTLNTLTSMLKQIGIEVTITQIKNIMNASSKIVTVEEKFIDKIIKLNIRARKSFLSSKEILQLLKYNSNFSESKFEKSYFSAISASHDDQINSVLVRVSILLYNSLNNKNFIGGPEEKISTIISVFSLFSTTNYNIVIALSNFYKIFSSKYNLLNKMAKQSRIENGDVTYIYLTLIEIMKEIVSDSKQTAKNFKSGKRVDSLSVREQNMSVRDLMVKHPEITLKQARFYVSHNDIEDYYTLKDYQIYNTSSYEAARYSMENLVKNKFYSKDKQGKKFVYKPLNKN